MSTNTISVMLADDQDLVRLGLATLLDNEPGFDVVGQAADGLDAVKEAQRTQPDVVLMDIRMPGIDGIEATRRIVCNPDLAGTKVVVLTTFEHDQYVFDALRHGASGFLLKDTPPAAVLDAMHVVADGGALLAPSVTQTLIEAFTSPTARATNPHPDIDELTEREREIVAHVAQGRNNHEIAADLVLSPATVRTHVSRSMVKLGAHDRAQLVVFAYQSGLA